MRRRIPVACNRDCGGGCPLLACLEDGRLTHVVDNPLGGPYMRGCVRGYEMARVVYAPDRLRQPLLRSGPRGSGRYREIAWEAALDLVAERLTNIKQRYGAESVLNLGSAGSCRGALHNTSRLTPRFLNLFGGCTAWRGSYSSQAVHFVMPYVLGSTPACVDPSTLQYAQLIVLWGANVADCRHGGETYARICEARQRGVEVIVIDPRRTRTASQLGARWIAVRPSTDAALMLAVLYVLYAENLAKRDFVGRYSVGGAELESYVLGETDGVAKTPAWAEAICGTPAREIVALARQFGRASPAARLPGLSIQRTLDGEDASRLSIALQIVTGNLGSRGGSSGAHILGNLPGPKMGSIPVPKREGQPVIEVYRWPDAVLEGRRGGYPSDIRAIYSVGGNFLAQGSDVRKNMRAFESVEFAVAHDCFLTPTARYCDVVLPSTTYLERQDIVFAPGNFVFFSNQALPSQGEARNDYDIFWQLAERLGFGPAFSEGKDEETWLRAFVAASEVPDYEAFRSSGVYAAPDRSRTAFTDFIADPQAHPLHTPSGLVEICSEAYAAATGYPALPGYARPPAPTGFPLQLITPKSRFRVHSQGANIAWFNEREPQALWMHPADASARGISDAQRVRVTSPQGTVCLPVRVTGDIMPGVVCLLEGMWPAFAAPGRGEAEVEVAGCANVLTSTEPALPSQGSRTHSVWVQVAAAPTSEPISSPWKRTYSA